MALVRLISLSLWFPVVQVVNCFKVQQSWTLISHVGLVVVIKDMYLDQEFVEELIKEWTMREK